MAGQSFNPESFDSDFDNSNLGIAVHAMDMNAPHLRIIEQPKQYGFRFRYECEGKSHGGIPGMSNERGKKTYPSCEIVNYKGLARIVVSLVTNEEMPRPHAHSLVGKHCTNGICSVQVGASDMTASFPNLGILHITKKNVIPILKKRMFDYQETSKNLWGQSNDQLTDPIAEQRAKELAKDMDLASVRLCFQAFLPDSNGHFTQPLPPVISVAIYDSKAPNATTLKICRMDRTSGSAEGGDEVYMLCDKVQKDDIQVRFFETTTDKNVHWEGFADFGPTDVHRQYAIVFKTPRYKTGEITKPVHVHLQLMRRSTKEKSEPKPFCYFPRPFDKDEINKKRQKLLPHFSAHFGPMGQRFPSGGGGSGGGTSGDGGAFQYGHSGNVQQSYSFNQSSVTMKTTANSPMQTHTANGQIQARTTNSPMQGQLATVNGAGIHDRQPSPFNPSSQTVYQPNLPNISASQMQHQPNHIIQAQNLQPVQQNYTFPQSMQQQPQQQQQQQQQPQVPMHFQGFIPRAASPKEIDTSKLISRGPKPATSEGAMLISRGLKKPSNSSGMDMDSGDSDIETDSAPDAESDRLFALAKNTSRALYDYSITGDVKMMLAVQRHLMAVQDDFGDTCLHMSIIHQEYEVTKSLLTIIASMPNQDIINMPNDLRQTPLHLAVITNRPKTVELLMDKGADPDIVDQHGNTALHLAVQHSSINSVYALLHDSKQPATSARKQPDVNTVNNDGYAPIHLACKNGSLKSLKALCHAHCNIDIQDGTSGYTPLHFAVENQDFGILGYLLLDTNANVHEVTFNGNTPLHLAAGRNLVAVAALLLASHADPLKENYDTYIDSSDSSDDEDEEGSKRSAMDISDDDICGKTPLDLASTDEMRRLLNGEPYIKSPSNKSAEFEFKLGLELSDTYDSFKIDSSMTSLCDPITLDKLARLLDQNETWADVANRVGLGNIISWLKQAGSPTRDLLYHFERIDGTMEELKQTLTVMGRTDAVEIIDDRSLTFVGSSLRPSVKDSRLDSVKDSGISEDLVETLRSMSVKAN
ncbi:nuclear factor NF-kappa-B p105 subunit-like isoform X2 [Anneissia japonica]|uniref:nuclear factor NF-kappa-B p105 subunit-like isoform X2 n=1 Tax=Anneissia japonica TaxID=1529436 RepID=UPI0014257088|nr:nuclear factor NF-kappa-B p105 subunit-like isoform X2 [Anneissia japonica]